MTFRRMSVRSLSSSATRDSRPPHIWIPKPKMIAATISGRMARRLQSSVKSGFVKKLMMSVPISTVPTPDSS